MTQLCLRAAENDRRKAMEKRAEDLPDRVYEVGGRFQRRPLAGGEGIVPPHPRATVDRAAMQADYAVRRAG